MKTQKYNNTSYLLPFGWLDETGQICTRKQGILYIGCPQCGAIFPDSCFCGWVRTKKSNSNDIYDDCWY